MGRLAVIPARGGSKRIPRKNIKSFCGKPIIAYSIQAAISSSLFDEVMVSTDDEEIAEVAKSYGAKVPFFRSAENSGDLATTAEVILEVLKSYEDRGVSFETGCCIYPTAPLITISSLRKGYKLLIEKGFTTVFPITEFSYPILRSLQRHDDERVSMNWPEYLLTRSQDLPPAYHDAGQFYWFDVKKFKDEPKLVSSNTGSVVLESIEVQDIDNEVDWKLAELKMRLTE